MYNTVAISTAAVLRIEQAHDGEWYRRCLAFVRDGAWDVPPLYPTAHIAWDRAKHKHPWEHGQGTRGIPAGAPLFTRPRNAGPNDPWHVVWTGHAWSKRTGQRIVHSTDVRVRGNVDPVGLIDLLERWNHVPVGWTEDLNGVLLPLGR